MKIKILQEAESELNDTIFYYEDKQAGLGVKFLDELKKHINWIENHPETPRLRNDSYRRVNLKVFPYYIPYIIRESVIWVVAIAHSNRLPEYWINRKDKG